MTRVAIDTGALLALASPRDRYHARAPSLSRAASSRPVVDGSGQCSSSRNSTLFYVMPFIRGESLRARIARHAVMPIEDSARIFAMWPMRWASRVAGAAAAVARAATQRILPCDKYA